MLNKNFGNLIDRIRLLFRKDKESYLCFYRMLGFYPHDIRIYEQALLHKSSSIKSDKGRLLNNERLEFLGDAILDAVVGDIVYRKFDGKREGFLTNTRSKIVSRESLNRVAEQIGLLKLVKSKTRQSAHNSYMGGNAFEALVGAVYSDRGYEYCKYFMENRIIGQCLNLESVSRKEVNFKSKLIEWTQKNKVEIVFDLIDQHYDEFNSPVFESEVLIEGIHACKGKGYSKKESQQIAAHETLNRIKKDSAFVESILSAKALREAPVEEEVPAKVVELSIPEIETEMSRRSDDLEDIISAAEEAAYASVEEGTVVAGKVVKAAEFGLFVEVGAGLVGLVHNTELSWNRNAKAEEVAQVGDEVEVFIKKIDRENKRVALSIKATQEDPWKVEAGKLNVGEIVEVEVLRFLPFGAIVKISDKVEGLVHISEIAEERIAKADDVLEAGQIVKAQVLKMDLEGKKIGLSIVKAAHAAEQAEYSSYLNGSAGLTQDLSEQLQ